MRGPGKKVGSRPPDNVEFGHFALFAEDGKEMDQDYEASTQPLCRSLNLLFSAVNVAVAVLDTMKRNL